MKKRIAIVKRKTKETDITIKLNIDGNGKININTGIGMLDHMLELFAFWGLFDLEIKTGKCDLKVDIHHTNEDIGIVLGQVFKKALGDKKGIKRFGSALVPMEEVVGTIVLDINGRGFYKANMAKSQMGEVALDAQDIYTEHFLESFAKNLGMNLNVKTEPFNADLHATIEPVFKALGIALDQATQIDPRRRGIPSTKGIID